MAALRSRPGDGRGRVRAVGVDHPLRRRLPAARAAPVHVPEVVEFCRWLDAGLGPDGRRLIYKLMLPRPELMLPTTTRACPAWEGRALTALYPVAVRWATRELALTDADDAPLVFAAFDAVAEQLGDKPFLFGERFTAADLTFACLAAAVVVPPEYGVQLPHEVLPERPRRRPSASTPPARSRCGSSASSGTRQQAPDPAREARARAWSASWRSSSSPCVAQPLLHRPLERVDRAPAARPAAARTGAGRSRRPRRRRPPAPSRCAARR